VRVISRFAAIPIPTWEHIHIIRERALTHTHTHTQKHVYESTVEVREVLRALGERGIGAHRRVKVVPTNFIARWANRGSQAPEASYSGFALYPGTRNHQPRTINIPNYFSSPWECESPFREKLNYIGTINILLI